MTPLITFEPGGKSVTVKPGTTLLAAGQLARVPIRTRCNGNAACLMCKVQVDEQSGLSPVERKEAMKLGGTEQDGWRLACQAKALGPATVRVPEDPLKAAVRRQLEQGKDEDLW